MARYEALKHLRVGDTFPAPGDPLESHDDDGRDWALMERVGDIGPWPVDKPWPEGEGSVDALDADAGVPSTVPSDEGYSVVHSGRGWYVIMKDGQKATKSLRKDDVSGFEELSEDEKAEYVEANKPD